MGTTEQPAPPVPGELTVLLARARQGDVSAEEQIYELAYAKLRRLAASYLRKQAQGHSLQPTEIVHEAYVRLAGAGASRLPKDRGHFFALAARAMRQILVDHARKKLTKKRGEDPHPVTLDDALGLASGKAAAQLDLLALDRALQSLGKLHERQARVAELRFFAGFTIAETAEALGVSTTTVEDDSVLARAWLQRALRGRPG